MQLIKSCLVMICVMPLVVGAACAQEKNVPLQSNLTDDGPSLEVAMKFIQDKLNAVGPLNYASLQFGTTYQFKMEVTKVIADPRGCRIDYHWYLRKTGGVYGEGGLVMKDRDYELPFKKRQACASEGVPSQSTAL